MNKNYLSPLILIFLFSMALGPVFAQDGVWTEDVAEDAGTSNWIYPSVLYHSDYSYICYMKNDNKIYVRSFQHSADFMTSEIEVSTNPLSIDYHYAPSIAKDSQNYLYVFYGAHNSPVYYRRSSNPLDVSSWGAQQNIGNNHTYQAVFWNSRNQRLILIARCKGDLWNTDTIAYYEYNPDTDIWSDGLSLVDFEDENGIFCTARLLDGEIHVIWSLYNRTDSTYRYVFHMYSINDGDTWLNMNGDILTLPVSAYSDVLVTLTTIHVLAWDIDLDINNYPQILYSLRENDANRTTAYLRLANWGGSSWNLGTVTVDGNKIYNLNGEQTQYYFRGYYYIMTANVTGSGGNNTALLRSTDTFTYETIHLDTTNFPFNGTSGYNINKGSFNNHAREFVIWQDLGGGVGFNDVRIFRIYAPFWYEEKFMFLLGGLGLAFMIGAPIYAVKTFQEKDYARALLIPFVLFCIGYGLIVSWLTS